jgi:hypothetical protein
MDAIGQWSNWVVVGSTLLIMLCTRLYCKKFGKLQEEEDVKTVPTTYNHAPPRWLFGWRQGWYCLQLVQYEWKEFNGWWRDPINQSWKDGEDTESVLSSDEEGGRERRLTISNQSGFRVSQECPLSRRVTF